MSYSNRLASAAAFAFIVVFFSNLDAFTQALPNPYRAADGWAQLPGGQANGGRGWGRYRS